MFRGFYFVEDFYVFSKQQSSLATTATPRRCPLVHCQSIRTLKTFNLVGPLLITLYC